MNHLSLEREFGLKYIMNHAERMLLVIKLNMKLQ